MSLPADVTGRLELASERLFMAATHTRTAYESGDVRAALEALRLAHDAAKAAREYLNQAGLAAKAEAERQRSLF